MVSMNRFYLLLWHGVFAQARTKQRGGKIKTHTRWNWYYKGLFGMASIENSYPLMDEQTPPLSAGAAVAESLRCLFCFDAPCIAACPTGIDIPSFIKKISTGNTVGAAKTILTANILGASCARVCPTEVLCEGACVVGHDHEPVKIGQLQRHATDYVMDHGISVLKPAKETIAFHIAVIGAGPAGLGCAAELAQHGHRVTIFEKDNLAGGLNTYGVAYYKMKPQVSLQEVELVKSLGVEIRTGIVVGQDISSHELLEKFDAVFIGVGLGSGAQLGIPGERGEGVREALDFIRDIHALPLSEVAVGRRVLVIGGGNTAIDAVDQAKRLGAETATLAYRRSEEEMSAYRFEIELARKDGCHFLFHAVPVEVVRGSSGKLDGVRFRHALTGNIWIEPCDQVLLAIGQPKQQASIGRLFPKMAFEATGTIQIDPRTGQTSMKKVFAGGDCANRGKEVVHAVGEGKKAAWAIHNMLTGSAIDLPVQPSRYGVAGMPAGSGILNPVRVF